MMRPRERLETVLRGGIPDRVPFYPVLRFWWEQQEEKKALPEIWREERGLVRLHADMQAGIYWPPENQWLTKYSQCSEKRKLHGLDRITEYETPVGCLNRVERLLPESQCWAPVLWPVKSREDLRVLRYFAADRRFLPDQDSFHSVVQMWGDNGIPLLLPPTRSPICALVYEWTGVEALSYLLADFPREVEATLKVLDEADNSIFETLCRWPNGQIVEFNDNLSSEVMTGLIRRFGKDNYARRIESLHAAGKFVSVHIDGTLKGLLELFGQLGFDCAEGITPQPTGDVDIKDLRSLAGPRIVLWGGLPGATFSPTFPEEDFRHVVLHAIDVCRRDPRFILGIGDILPPDGILDRVKWVGELVESEGGYQKV